MRKVSDEARLEILIAYAGGEKGSSIAQRHGVSRTYPAILAQQVGIRRSATAEDCRQAYDEFVRRSTARQAEPASPPADTEPEVGMVTEIRRLAAKGVARTAIAALLRCNHSHVAMALD